jgi:ABC-type multidrug transport system fused ATPase/permease subunit
MNFLKSIWLNRAYNLGLSNRVIATLVMLSIATTVTEALGIGIFLPIFQFIRLEGDLNALVADSSLWRYIINFFTYFNLEPSLAILLVLSFSLFLGRQILTFVRLVYTNAVTQRLIQAQRNHLFDRYIEANSSYHDSVPVGNLLNVIIVEAGGAVVAIMTPIELSVYVIMLTGYLGMLFMLSWQMTLLSSIILIFVGFIPKVWIKKSAITGRKLVNANTMMSDFLIGRLRSPRLVRLSGTESAEKEEFHNLTLAQRKYAVHNSVLQSKTDISMEPIIIGVSLIFLYFSYTMLQLQIEIIGLYLVIAMRLMPIVKSIVLKIQSIHGMLGSVEILEKRFKTMKESQEKDNGSRYLRKLNDSILIDKVNYRYPETKDDVLKDVTIEFKVNEMAAIVGPSGSGKSTLIDLLPRLRLPTKGVIRVDGESIEKYKLKSLRQLISYVPQSPQIFNGTVKNHIHYGKRDATDKEIRAATSLAGAEEFIKKLPQGFNTVLGDDAVKLSGGQRQRLDLSRALVRKAKILILDEPNSNLDAESEEMFRKALIRIRKETNTMIIVVAHRLASIVDADQIVVLNEGKVEAVGTHTELLKQKGWYAKAWKMQKPTSD